MNREGAETYLRLLAEAGAGWQRRPAGPPAPDRPRVLDPAAARAAADPSHGLDRGAGRRPVGRGPRQAVAPLGVPVVTTIPGGPGGSSPRPDRGPNEPWYACVASCEALVPCGQGRHIVRWEAGTLRLASHADAEAELVLAALGGEKARCVEVAEAWGRHAADLTVLGVGPRGPADEIVVSWNDVDAAAQGAQRGGRTGYAPLPGGPGHGPMQLASPPSSAALARASARRTLFQQEAQQSRQRRIDILSLLALGYGFQVRLTGQVVAAHAGQLDEQDERGRRIRPVLAAALAWLAPVAEQWLGIDPDQVVAELHRGPGWGSVKLAGRGEQRRLQVSLPAEWLARVWAAGLALAGRHLVVAVQRAGWPDARVLALRAPGADPVPLDVHASPDAPHWEI